MVLTGYFVGKAVPNLEAVFLVIVAVLVMLSVAPAGVHVLRERRAAARAKTAPSDPG